MILKGEHLFVTGGAAGIGGEEKIGAIKFHRTENWRRQADPSSQAQGRG